MSTRYTDKPHRPLKQIDADIKHWNEQSAACPLCVDGCWCDDDFSPEARLADLRAESSATKVDEEWLTSHHTDLWEVGQRKMQWLEKYFGGKLDESFE